MEKKEKCEEKRKKKAIKKKQGTVSVCNTE